MTTYETMFIFPPDLPQEKFDAISEKIKGLIIKHKGEVLSFKHWGRKRLAYPIKNYVDGNFYCLTFNAPSSLVSELDMFCRISADVIMRHMTTRRKEEKKKTESNKVETGAEKA